MTLNELLDLSPEDRAKIPLPQLKTMLEPYFPAVRKAVLPPENYKKMGIANAFVKNVLETNRAAIEEILKGGKK